jgi:hypothetical protein
LIQSIIAARVVDLPLPQVLGGEDLRGDLSEYRSRSGDVPEDVAAHSGPDARPAPALAQLVGEVGVVGFGELHPVALGHDAVHQQL